MKIGGSTPTVNSGMKDLVLHKQQAEVSPLEEKQNKRMDNKNREINKDDLIIAVGKLNKTIEPYQEGIQFIYNKDAGRMVVKVINTATGEVIKQMPPQDVIDMIVKIRRFIGLIIDEKI